MTLNPMPGPSWVPGWKDGLQEEGGFKHPSAHQWPWHSGGREWTVPESRILSPVGMLDMDGLKWDKASTVAPLRLRRGPDLGTRGSPTFSSGRAAWLNPDIVLNGSLEAPPPATVAENYCPGVWGPEPEPCSSWG